MHGLPIIARDLPVFREVAAEHAFYFEGESGDSLASAIRTWLDLHSRGLTPSSEGLNWLTWEESAEQLMEVVMGNRIYREWSFNADERSVGAKELSQRRD
jgi:glycosyltransferase involved in cell wall biosynthesis